MGARFAQLKQLGFVTVDRWNKDYFGERTQRQLLTTLRNESQATELK